MSFLIGNTWILYIAIALIIAGLIYILTHREPDKRSFDEKISDTKNRSNSTSSALGNLTERINVESETKLKDALTANIDSTVKLEATAESAPLKVQAEGYRAKADVETAKFDYEHTVDLKERLEEQSQVQHENLIATVQAATDNLLPVTEYAELQKLLLLDNARLDNLWREKQIHLQTAFLFDQKDFQLLYMLIEHANVIELRAEQSQGHQRERWLRHVKFLEGVILERQRLLQTSTQADLRGSDSDSDSGRDN